MSVVKLFKRLSSNMHYKSKNNSSKPSNIRIPNNTLSSPIVNLLSTSMFKIKKEALSDNYIKLKKYLTIKYDLTNL